MSHFDTFWRRYPKKVNKIGCKKKWVAKKLDDQAEKIFAYLDYVQRKDDKWKGGFIPNPETLINQERWNDFEIPKITSSGTTQSDAVDLNRVVDWVKENVKLTPEQLTSQWKWIWSEGGNRYIGVLIPDMQPLMFKSFKGEGV